MSSRVLVVGAGATGGYFGGRLAAAGRDVTFLVRPKRAAELADTGLVIKSPFGDVRIERPATVVAADLDASFDLVLLSCKAYDLEGAIDAFAPAVGEETVILPLLNGMRHLDVLDEQFGREKVLGGLCTIAATLDAQRSIVHLNELHSLTFGDRERKTSDRVKGIATLLSDAGFDARASESIVHDMWEKWVFLASLASATCMMRASVGDILAAPGGKSLLHGLLDECRAIAKAAGFTPRPAFLQKAVAMLTDEKSRLTASMLRDIESNARIEADHVIGDLRQRRTPANQADDRSSLLDLAYTHLKAYENRNGSVVA